MQRPPEMTDSQCSTASQTPARYQNSERDRQAFHHPRTSLGAAGHWIHLLGVTAPLVIGEVITDPNARWRALRLSAVGTALLSEAVWTHRLMKERQKDEEARAALKSCSDHCR
jgi:hypothetical protein